MTEQQKRALAEKARGEMQRRSDAFRAVFGADTVHAQAVLEDLSRFCRASESTFHPDPRVAAALDGRREVFLRIRAYLDRDVDELLRQAGAVS